MADAQAKRRLAAVLAADVAGYSRLMGEDEEATLASLNGHIASLIAPRVADNNGRIFKTTGDGLLVEFASVVDAVKCAVTIQDGMALRNADVAEGRRLEFRIGINIGDVIVQGDDVYGDGVNVAARLEGLAQPGGICISRAARDQIRDRLDYGLEDWGEVKVKNISRPVRVFRLLPSPEDAGKVVQRKKEHSAVHKAAVLTGLLLAVSAVVGGGLAWLKPWLPTIEAASVEKMAFSLPIKPSIAVLPFANLSNDKDQEYFADGITEDIVTDISKVSGILVVAHGSTLAYKGEDVMIRQVAEDLGVRYVLSGSVRRADNTLRITAQLIDAVKGEHLWSERYDREVNGVFAVQSEITQQVVKAMTVTLKASEHDRLFQKYITNIDAYDTFLRARATVDAPTRENIELGEKLFKRTIELDPKFAGGYAGLSFNYSVKARFRFGESPQDDALRSLELAEQAIRADSEFSWSHIALAGAYLANGRHDEAVDAVRQAVVIQPSGYEANLFLGFYLNFAGQSAQAVEYLETANDLSRIDTIRGLDFLGMAYFTDGRYADCEAIWTRRFQRFGVPDYPIGHVFLAAAQASLDRMDMAAATVERFGRLSPEFRMSNWLWINNYKRPEDRARLYDAAIRAGIPD
jgi:adenylate cyclase